jgi:serine protease Do
MYPRWRQGANTGRRIPFNRKFPMLITRFRFFPAGIILAASGACAGAAGVDAAADIPADPPAVTAALAERFPLDTEPVDRSRQDRIVSFSGILGEATPAVVGVYPSRIVKVSERGRGSNPLEEMLRDYYGIEPREPGENNEGGERKMRQGMGSGVLISADGYVLTNHHVINDEHGNSADEVLVRMNDGREFAAAIVGSDEHTDVAVLKIAENDLPFLPMADSENLQVGDIVFAVGNPLSVGLTVTMGIVSATGRTGLGILGQRGYEDFIQTDASINPGNSGGALVDADGRLVGINSAIYSRSGGSIGIGFAIPVTLAREISLSLLETGTVQRGFLGVGIKDLSRDLAEAFGRSETSGALVQEVHEGLPAARAGIERGDIIIAVSDAEINSANDLRFVIASIPPGTAVTVTVVRDGQERVFDVVLSNLENPGVALGPARGDDILEGVVLELLSDTFRGEFDVEEEVSGVAVVKVNARSPHAKTLRAGMVIVEINDDPVGSIENARVNFRPGVNKLWIYDRGGYAFATVRVE